MSIVFLFSGKQCEYIPKKREVFRVDFQRNLSPGEFFILDRVLRHDDSFGQPFLKTHLKAQVIRHGLKKKITIFRYKAKKRCKVKKGHRTRYTEIKILEIQESQAQQKPQIQKSSDRQE